MVGVVAALAGHEPQVIGPFGQGGRYLQVGAEPVHLGAVPAQVAAGRLEEDTDRLVGLGSDQLRVAVSSVHLGEASEEAEHPPEPSWGQPGGGERTVPSAAPTTNGPLGGILGDPITLLDRWQDLGGQENGVPVVEGVVLVVAVPGLAGIDEDTDRGRHLPSVN